MLIYSGRALGVIVVSGVALFMSPRVISAKYLIELDITIVVRDYCRVVSVAVRRIWSGCTLVPTYYNSIRQPRVRLDHRSQNYIGLW